MLRVYLAGRITVEQDGRLLTESQLPSRQARLALAFLGASHRRPVAREDLAEALWPEDERPAAWDTGLNALVSKLRAAFRGVGLLEVELAAQFGCLHLLLPPGAWVDLEAAATAIDEAEGSWRSGGTERAWGEANVALTISRQPFLPNEERAWIQSQRTALRLILGRALLCLSQISQANGERNLALQYAQELVDLEPLRETGWQQLMRVHHALGNRGEALRVYAACRERLREELGASPSAESEALFLSILRA